MSDLIKKLEEKLAYDHVAADTAADNARSYQQPNLDLLNVKAIHYINTFTNGAGFENRRLQPLHQALIECVKAYSNAGLECSALCYDEYPLLKTIHYDYCCVKIRQEALDSLQKLVSPE